jgi:hypothetical protein
LLTDADPPETASAQAAAWASQALIEFQDLQMLLLPEAGRFLNTGYCFHEALAALRESVVAGLNGQVHAALAVLRSALELHCFHYWWREELWSAPTYERFYRWLETGEGGAGFSQVIAALFAQERLPPGATTETHVREIYRRLCSYSHKPLLDEAITPLRANDPTESGAPALFLWLSLLGAAQRAMLDLAIAKTPLAIFPLPLARKFGFNPPLGLFFDAANFAPLERALGSQVIATYRDHYRDRDPPQTQIEWFESRPERSEEEILASWTAKTPLPGAGRPFEERVILGYAVVKSEMRALAACGKSRRIDCR